MPEIFAKTVEKFASLPALGTRELLSESDEVQPNGKVFKKAVFGKYHWMTYQEVAEQVESMAKGWLTQLVFYFF